MPCTQYLKNRKLRWANRLNWLKDLTPLISQGRPFQRTAPEGVLRFKAKKGWRTVTTFRYFEQQQFAVCPLWKDVLFQKSTVWLFLYVWLLWLWNLSCWQLLARAKGSTFFSYKLSSKFSWKLTRLGRWTSFPELLLSKDQEKNKILVEPGKTLYFVLKNTSKQLIRTGGTWATDLIQLPLFLFYIWRTPLLCFVCVLFFQTGSRVVSLATVLCHATRCVTSKNRLRGNLCWILRKPTTLNNLSLTELTKPVFRTRYDGNRLTATSVITGNFLAWQNGHTISYKKNKISLMRSPVDTAIGHILKSQTELSFTISPR